MDEEAYQKLAPIALEVEAGKLYTWCGCGKSALRPLCDKTGDCTVAVDYLAPLNETVYFCGCLHTKKPPFCDGSHGKLLLQGLIK